MTGGPLQHAVAFWKPLIDARELERLSSYREPGEVLPGEISVWRTGAEAKAYRVVDGAQRFALFAAVHPIAEAPESAEVVADILDSSGGHYSYVLWYPHTRSVVVPFDPDAAIEAFWYERYVPASRHTVLPRSVLATYYGAVKRLLPVALRVRLRKILARRAFAEERLLEWPGDRSLDLLQTLLMRLILMTAGRTELQFAWFWPNRHPWAVTLTHDVETGSGLARVMDVAQLERERGLRSSFNLVPLDYEVPGSLLQQMRDAGLEIGVHGYTHDGMLFSKWTTFLDRVVTINECGRRWGAAGFRSPATYRNQEWFHLLAFEYESSTADTAPFEPQPGGCATFFPFPIDELIELPITLPQDHTLFGLLEEKHAQTWLTKLQWIRESNGMACVLTHPDPSAGYIGVPDNEAHYAELLDFIAHSDAWTPLPRDLAAWWRARARATPEQAGDGETAGGVAGGSFGIATLDSSGRLDVIPPSPPAPAQRPSAPARMNGRRDGGDAPDGSVRMWIDMANSPHVQFFAPLIREMEARGHSVLVTARDFAQTVELLDKAGVEHTTIGHHGGYSLLRKAVAIGGRARSLADYARRNRVDVAVHHSSYAQAIAAWLSGVPSLALMDYEYQPANHVSFRLSDMVLVPESIPTGALVPYGASWRLRRFAGLKEDFYVASMIAAADDEATLTGLDPARPLLVLRPPPDLAAYHHFENRLWIPLLEYLSGQAVADVLVLPRTNAQRARLAARAYDGVKIADRAIAPAALLRHADGVITAGGTMGREAAALGIPAYTIFAGRRGQVDARLISEGRLIEISKPGDFGLISLEKRGPTRRASLSAEHERVSRLADLVVAMAH